MTPKEARQRFTKRYPIEAINSLRKLEDLSFDRVKFHGFALTESANKFETYLEGYLSFKLDGPSNNAREISNDGILDGTQKLINDILFESVDVNCHGALGFVAAYLEHLDELEHQLDVHTETMFERGADNKDIGLLTTMTSEYLTALTEKVDQTMDQLLRISGYHSHQVLMEAVRSGSKKVSDHDYFL